MLYLFFAFFMAFWPSHAHTPNCNHTTYQSAAANGEDDGEGDGEDGGPGGETGHIPNQPPPRPRP
jgi:hypothetical protein